jgi:hypothetical protein
MRGEARAEEGAALDAVGLDVLGYGLGRAEVNALDLGAVAFQMKAQRRLVAVLVEVEDVELAAGFDARSGVDVEFDDGAVAQIQESESPVTIATNAAPVFPRGRGFHRRGRRPRER